MRIYSLPMIVLFGSGLIITMPPALAQKEQWAETAMAAKGAIEEHLYDKATSLYSQALKVAETFGEDDPRLTATLRDTADCLMQYSHNYALAEQMLKREQRIMLRLGPDFPGLVAGKDLLGRAQYGQGKYKEAEESFQEAIKISPEAGGFNDRDWRQEILPRLGRCYQAEGNYEQAEGCFKTQLASAMAKHAGVQSLYYPYRNLANYYFETQNYDKAVFLFKRCLAILQNSPNWQDNHNGQSQDLLVIGAIYSAQKKDEEAIKYFRQAAHEARQDPNAAETLFQALYPNLAKLELARGNKSASQAAANEALAIAKRLGYTVQILEINKFLSIKSPVHK